MNNLILLNYIVYKKEGVTKQESFSKQFGEIKGLFIKSLLEKLFV